MNKPPYPFDSARCIGTVIEVGPSHVKVNLPSAATPDGQFHHGQRMGRGEVGEFVVAECGDVAVLGRITTVRLPERERLSVDPELGKTPDVNPVGTIQLLSSVILAEDRVIAGIGRYPRLASKVYSAHPDFLGWLMSATDVVNQDGKSISLRVASVPEALATIVSITPERLFGRHCAVLGSTGGGKSWTLATILEELTKVNAKVVLLDATGEYLRLKDRTRHVRLGKTGGKSTDVVLPYSQLTESDLFALFTPSGQSQLPKLRAAIKSLKIARVEPALAPTGVLVKANRSKSQYNNAYRKHRAVIDAPQADFDVQHLTRQIDEECVWPTDKSDATKWGGPYENDRTYCVNLITRIEALLQSPQLRCLFEIEGRTSLLDVLDEFRESKDAILRISLKHLGFGNSVREIVANAIGRRLLENARGGAFKFSPLLVVLDEAHQFLNRSLGDEANKYPLDAFELIAKEGRKYGLTICMATQRPRDLPEGVLSQMGAMVVHRLINEKDREVVERACGDIDRSAAAFLPTLAPGQAILIGTSFPIPVTVEIFAPLSKPDSKGPDYQTRWRPDDTEKEAN